MKKIARAIAVYCCTAMHRFAAVVKVNTIANMASRWPHISAVQAISSLYLDQWLRFKPPQSEIQVSFERQAARLVEGTWHVYYSLQW